MLCKTHGTPMREVSDAFNFGSFAVECEACDLEKSAVAREAMAKKDPKSAHLHLDIAAKRRAKAKLLSGRWFEVMTLGGKRDMSEGQIEALKASGEVYQVITQIV